MFWCLLLYLHHCFPNGSDLQSSWLETIASPLKELNCSCFFDHLPSILAIWLPSSLCFILVASGVHSATRLSVGKKGNGVREKHHPSYSSHKSRRCCFTIHKSLPAPQFQLFSSEQQKSNLSALLRNQELFPDAIKLKHCLLYAFLNIPPCSLPFPLLRLCHGLNHLLSDSNQIKILGFCF